MAVDEKQDNPDSSITVQTVACAMHAVSLTDLCQRAGTVHPKPPSVQANLHDRLHTWGMAKAACS